MVDITILMSRPSILTSNVTMVFNSNIFLVYDLPQICHYSAALNRFLSSSDIINGLLKCFFIVFFYSNLLLPISFSWNYRQHFLLYISVFFYYICHHNSIQFYIHTHSLCVFCMLLYMTHHFFVYILKSFLLLLQNLHRWQKVLVIVCGIIKF